MSGSNRVAVLGMGAMGRRIAANLSESGHGVVVWNRTPDVAAHLARTHGLDWAESRRNAVGGADVAISMVTDDDASRSLWLDSDDGALAAVSPGATIIESSTLTPAAVTKLATEANERGVAFLEAPVVGSRPQAESGMLLYLVGGDRSVLNRVRSLIDVNAGAVHHAGRPGDAATLKLAINGLFAIQVAAYAEILAMLGTSTVTDGPELLRRIPITSPALERIIGLIGDQDSAPNFPIGLVAKDLRYLGQVSEALGASTPLSRSAAEVFDRLARTDASSLDIAGVATHYRR